MYLCILRAERAARGVKIAVKILCYLEQKAIERRQDCGWEGK